MRAFFFSALCSLLGLASTSVPAAAANNRVTVVNHSAYTGVVSVHQGGKEIGRGLVHTQRSMTMNTPVNPAGGNISVELTSNGKLVCKGNGTIASAATRWIITPPCGLKRG